MNVLWLVNVILPDAGKALGIPFSVYGGWLTGALNGIKAQVDNLSIVTTSPAATRIQEAKSENITFIVCPTGTVTEYEEMFRQLLKREYDVIHIFGTEYAHALAMANVAPSEKMVVTIQGLMSICTSHYREQIPQEFYKDTWDRKLMRKLRLAGKSIEYQHKEFAKQTAGELQVLQKTKFVIGRTSWDRACVSQINPEARYFKVNETLRPTFYNQKQWQYDRCKKHSIFMSQASYPIKGLHMFLQALPEIRKHFPDLQVYIAGNGTEFTRQNKQQQFWSRRYGGYRGYLQTLVNRYALWDCIQFTGQLDERQMQDQYLRANIFVLPSAIENSPNSLGEAMLTGAPCVAAYVGGIPDMLDHRKEGILYPFNAPYMLADAVKQIFQDGELAEHLGKNGKKHAEEIFDPQDNAKALIDVYNTIFKG